VAPKSAKVLDKKRPVPALKPTESTKKVAAPVASVAQKPAAKSASTKPAGPSSRPSRGKALPPPEVKPSDLKPDREGYVFFRGRRVRLISTKNAPPKRTTRSSASARGNADDAGERKPIKTKLSKKELDFYRQLLILKRAEKLGDLRSKETEALQSGGGNLSHMPIHMADIGSDAYDQDFTLGLAESDRKLIREIDDALQRIADKTYGMCMHTGKPIPKARLNAKPWAKYTIEAARLVESGHIL